ncbi:hypothetical protein ACFFRR_001761 [Megaselia abdita]
MSQTKKSDRTLYNKSATIQLEGRQGENLETHNVTSNIRTTILGDDSMIIDEPYQIPDGDSSSSLEAQTSDIIGDLPGLNKTEYLPELKEELDLVNAYENYPHFNLIDLIRDHKNDNQHFSTQMTHFELSPQKNETNLKQDYKSKFNEQDLILPRHPDRIDLLDLELSGQSFKRIPLMEIKDTGAMGLMIILVVILIVILFFGFLLRQNRLKRRDFIDNYHAMESDLYPIALIK